MVVRQFRPEDHPTVCSWWDAQKWPRIPLEALPKRGVIVEGLCAGFLYITDSPLSLLEWVVANPASDKMERHKALDLLISTLLKEADAAGRSMVFSFASHPGLLERYKSHGFTVADQGLTNVVRVK